MPVDILDKSAWTACFALSVAETRLGIAHEAILFGTGDGHNIIHLITESDGVPVEVALTYNTGYSETIHSFVNNINTYEGGTHLDGFRSALGGALKEYGNKEKMFEKAKLANDIKAEDFKEGLTAVVSVKVAEPQFEGQTKTKLGNVEVRPAVQKAVRGRIWLSSGVPSQW